MSNGNPVSRMGDFLDDSERSQEERGETWKNDGSAQIRVVRSSRKKKQNIPRPMMALPVTNTVDNGLASHRATTTEITHCSQA
jgi:hypothetical protein